MSEATFSEDSTLKREEDSSRDSPSSSSLASSSLASSTTTNLSNASGGISFKISTRSSRLRADKRDDKSLKWFKSILNPYRCILLSMGMGRISNLRMFSGSGRSGSVMLNKRGIREALKSMYWLQTAH